MVKLVVFNGLAESELHYCSQFLSNYLTSSEYQCWLFSSLPSAKLATVEAHRNAKVFRIADDVAMILRLARELASGSYWNNDEVYLLGFEGKVANALKDHSRVKIICYSYTASMLHDVFGCSKACTVTCQHCPRGYHSTVYKKCDEKLRKQHETMCCAGICVNSNCVVEFPQCARLSEKAVAHVLQHKICKPCGRAGTLCQIQCNLCYVPHCNTECPRYLNSLQTRCARCVTTLVVLPSRQEVVCWITCGCVSQSPTRVSSRSSRRATVGQC
jgi:hypothetical protein